MKIMYCDSIFTYINVEPHMAGADDHTRRRDMLQGYNREFLVVTDTFRRCDSSDIAAELICAVLVEAGCITPMLRDAIIGAAQWREDHGLPHKFLLDLIDDPHG